MKSIEEIIAEQDVQKYEMSKGSDIHYVRLALEPIYASKYVLIDRELSSFCRSKNINSKKQLVVAFGYLKNSKINLVSSIEDFSMFLSNKENNTYFDVIVVISTCDRYQVINFAQKESNIVSMSNFQIGMYICNQINKGRTIEDISLELNKSLSLTYKLKRFGMFSSDILSLVNCDRLTFKDVELLHELVRLKEKDIFKYASIFNELVNYESHLLVMDRIKNIFHINTHVEKSIVFCSKEVKAICSVSSDRLKLDCRNIDNHVTELILAKTKEILSEHYS